MPAASSRPLEGLAKWFERVNGRPLVAACPPGCGCRGVPEVEERARPRGEELAGEPALAGR
jgi:hypothetical protein